MHSPNNRINCIRYRGIVPTRLFNRYYDQMAQVYPSIEYAKNIFDKFMDSINTKNADARVLLKYALELK